MYLWVSKNATVHNYVFVVSKLQRRNCKRNKSDNYFTSYLNAQKTFFIINSTLTDLYIFNLFRNFYKKLSFK